MGAAAAAVAMAEAVDRAVRVDRKPPSKGQATAVRVVAEPHLRSLATEAEPHQQRAMEAEQPRQPRAPKALLWPHSPKRAPWTKTAKMASFVLTSMRKGSFAQRLVAARPTARRPPADVMEWVIANPIERIGAANETLIELVSRVSS